jgi:rubrerythrin
MADLKKSLEALKLALKTEQEGYNLYKEGARQTQNEFVRDIFTQLFKDELMHMDLIKRFYAELNQSGSWAKLSAEEKDYKGLKGEIKTIFTRTLDAVLKGKETISNTDLNVYQKAIDFENRGISMYGQLYKETVDEKAKNFYGFLRDMEQDHADVLDNTMQYLKDPKNWYLKNEGWTLDY